MRHRLHEWAGIGQSVQCVTLDWTTGVQFQAGAKEFSSILCVQTDSGAYPASYPMGTGRKSRPGRDADHSPPSRAEVKNK
jgi:hypothetical protein